MRKGLTGVGIAVGSVAALIGTIWTLMLAWGIWHGGTLKGVGWHVDPHPILALIVLGLVWEFVAGLCYVVGFLPFYGLAMLFPERD